MPFHYYTNMLSRASRSVASGLLVVGLLLIGFGTLIAVLPKLFAYMAAAVFFLAGIGSIIAGIKIFWVRHRLDRFASHEDLDSYRENVRIHTADRHDL